jgi:DegV family protein with EDD domain
MTRTAIITDSSAYLPKELMDQFQIEIVPLSIIWGSQTLLDGVEISPSEFLERLEKDPVHPSTTQPNPEDFQAVFEKVAGSFDGIVAPLISSELSGTVNSALSAQANFTSIPVRVVDTRTTSMGLGFAVLDAARAAASGRPLAEVEKAAQSAAAASRVMFVVDTLEFLHKGGRIGGASRLLGSALSLKPILHLDDGRVDALDRVRTKAKAVDRLMELAKEAAGEKPVRASVIHAGARDEAQALKSRVAETMNCKELYITELSPAISVHTGPGTVGIALCTVVP